MDEFAVRGGLVYDGTGAPLLAFTGGCMGAGRWEIMAVGVDAGGSDIPAACDASGCVVTPGFVDIHRHCDTPGAPCPGRAVPAGWSWHRALPARWPVIAGL
ncbi:MAG: hypothetical protein ACLVEX_04030 [Ruthenibacterium lactatiformans]